MQYTSLLTSIRSHSTTWTFPKKKKKKKIPAAFFNAFLSLIVPKSYPSSIMNQDCIKHSCVLMSSFFA